MATFTQAELEGWNRNANDYESLVLPATSQAFGGPIIDSLGILTNTNVLEMASGTGHLGSGLPTAEPMLWRWILHPR
jgi:hypothetical protein